MTILFRIILCLGIVLSTAANATEPLLRRGINLSDWLADAKRQPVYARDMESIAHGGFDHVRISVDPESLNLSTLDTAIALATHNHLQVILDIHPLPPFMHRLETQQEAENSFIALWQTLAQHYASIPAQQLAFELLNEPQYYKNTARYTALMERTIAAIRARDTTRLLIMDAPVGASIAGLTQMQPVQDKHILYAFHFYEPYIITHQGIHMGFENKMTRYFSHLPYPSSLATGTVDDYAPDAPDPFQAEDELDEYKATPWDATTIAARIAYAKAWAEKNHVHLICTEFGALRHTNDADSRYRWINDVRTALEDAHIGFSLWAYTDLFGITTLQGKTSTDPVDKSVRFADPEQGTRIIEKEALRALGLQP